MLSSISHRPVGRRELDLDTLLDKRNLLKFGLSRAVMIPMKAWLLIMILFLWSWALDNHFEKTLEEPASSVIEFKVRVSSKTR